MSNHWFLLERSLSERSNINIIIWIKYQKEFMVNGKPKMVWFSKKLKLGMELKAGGHTIIYSINSGVNWQL